MITGRIESIAFGGEGILRHDGLVVFVPFTAPGDIVEVEVVSKKKNFAHGKLLRLISNSPQRTHPHCPYFGTCGGCTLQHLNYSAQIDAKRTFILDALQRIGKLKISDVNVLPATTEWHYRRHIRLTLKKHGNGFQAGYIGHNPSEFVPVSKCPIFIPMEESLLGTLETLLLSLENTGIEEGTVRLIKAPENKYIFAFQFSPTLPPPIKQLPHNVQGIIMQSPSKQTALGNIECTIQVLGLDIRFSPYGFVQNHPEQSEHLYRAILNAIDTPKKILDLYCGIGITSLLFAQKQIPVIGVESHAETVDLARENALLNNITGAEFHRGKAETLGVEILKKEKPDVVLCNPPRTGLDPKLLDALIQEKPACILYVSCMPATLARDLQKLVQAGYAIETVQGFDMFPQTTHVETLAVCKQII